MQINKSDKELMIQAQEGCQKAFEELVQRHEANLRNWISKLIHDYEEACDVVQDAFLLAYRHRDSYNPRYPFKTWLYTIARNRATTHLRKRGRLIYEGSVSNHGDDIHQDSSWIENTVDLRPIAYECAISEEQVSWLHETIDSLEESHREVLVLKFFNGMKSKDIAEKMGLEIGTVWSRVHHGIKKLQARAIEMGYCEDRNGKMVSL